MLCIRLNLLMLILELPVMLSVAIIVLDSNEAILLPTLVATIVASCQLPVLRFVL